MKKKKETYFLNVPTPCHEKWSEMTPSQQGRFCNQCSKTIIDFSEMSDKEIVNFLENNSSKICARLNVSQIERPIIGIPSPHVRTFYPLPQLLSGLLLLGFPEYGITQNDTVRTEVTTTGQKDLSAPPDTIHKNTIEGKLISYGFNEPVSFCTVHLKDMNGNSITTACSDADGFFKIIVPQTIQGDLIIIEFLPEHNHISNKKISINKNEDLPWKQEVELVPTQEIRRVVGMVTIATEPQISKRRWFKKRK